MAKPNGKTIHILRPGLVPGRRGQRLRWRTAAPGRRGAAERRAAQRVDRRGAAHCGGAAAAAAAQRQVRTGGWGWLLG